MKNLTVSVSGGTASGKSTLLVLLAQYLHKLYYSVSVPKHLIGMSVNEDLLRERQSADTAVRFVENFPLGRDVSLNIGDHVIYTSVCGPKYEGKPAGVILGFYTERTGLKYVIVQLLEPDSSGNMGALIHPSALEKVE